MLEIGLGPFWQIEDPRSCGAYFQKLSKYWTRSLLRSDGAEYCEAYRILCR